MTPNDTVLLEDMLWLLDSQERGFGDKLYKLKGIIAVFILFVVKEI
jgi:hypothetical protein